MGTGGGNPAENQQSAKSLNAAAWAAFRDGEFERALELVDACHQVGGEKTPAALAKMRATVLGKLGRTEDAETAFSELLEREPDRLDLKAGLGWSTIANCRRMADSRQRRAALAQFVRERIERDSSFAAQSTAVDLLFTLGDYEAASHALLRMVRAAASPEEMAKALRRIPELCEPGGRDLLWADLLSRLPSSDAPDLQLRLLLALGRTGEFVERFDEVEADLSGAAPLFPLLGAARVRLGKPRHEVAAERKVFGIGLSKTGTNSLTSALTMLGIDAAHWTNPLTGEILSDRDFLMFGACTDISVAQNFERLYYRYPNALFVWTQRSVDSWANSLMAHHRRASWVSTFAELRDLYSRPFCPHMSPNAEIHFGMLLNHRDPFEAHAAFEQRVRRFFADKPKNKLLEIDFFEGDGWPELCEFLGVPVPDRPFPKLNVAPS